MKTGRDTFGFLFAAVSVTIVASTLLAWSLGIITPRPIDAQPVSGRVTIDHPNRWTAGFNSVAAALAEVKAVPPTGQAHYITALNIQTTTATSGTYALQSGTGTACATATTAVFPVRNASDRFNAPIVSSAMASIQFQPPIKLTAGHALCIIGVATNTVSGQVQGFNAP